MKRVYLASPYSGDVLTNVDYARRCMADSLKRCEAPFVPHLLYTQCLDDTDEAQRKRDMRAGAEFLRSCHKLVAYIDRGISAGMQAEIDLAADFSIPVEMRHIGVDYDHEETSPSDPSGAPSVGMPRASTR